jgi:hypothetical protein
MGIVFLNKGYLNIVCYQANNSHDQQNVFYTFIETLSIPGNLRYPKKKPTFFLEAHPIIEWTQSNWQKFTGVCIFLFVYGAVFLQRKESGINASR